MDRKRVLSWLLRLAGTVEILAFIAVVMPRRWMEVSHVWLGLGEMPHSSILMFMIRQASYAYGMHGVSLWVLARDVDRFRPLVLLNGFAYLLATLIFFMIDYTSNLPIWWAVMDSGSCGLFGVAVLWLSGRTEPR
jgi:hypothetical protein